MLLLRMTDFDVNNFISQMEADLNQKVPDLMEKEYKNKNSVFNRLGDQESKNSPIIRSKHKISYTGNGPSETANKKLKLDLSKNSTKNNISNVVKRNAVCPLYLKNLCHYSDETCNMLHTKDKKYMPHCYHFINQNCYKVGSNDSTNSCPYLHVYFGQDPSKIEICQIFLKNGCCEKAEKCDKYHVPICQNFMKHGKCVNFNCLNHHPGQDHKNIIFKKRSRKTHFQRSSENKKITYVRDGSAHLISNMNNTNLKLIDPFTIKSLTTNENAINTVIFDDFEPVSSKDVSDSLNLSIQSNNSVISSQSSLSSTSPRDDSQPYFGGAEDNYEQRMEKLEKRRLRMESKNLKNSSSKSNNGNFSRSTVVNRTLEGKNSDRNRLSRIYDRNEFINL